MNPFEDRFRRYTDRRTVGGNFEERVFAKIRRKKTVRRIGYSAFTFLLVVSILVSLLIFLQGGDTDSRMSGRLARGLEHRSGNQQVKEDIPVMEDLYFAPYDGRTNYAIHQVSLTEDDGGI